MRKLSFALLMTLACSSDPSTPGGGSTGGQGGTPTAGTGGSGTPSGTGGTGGSATGGTGGSATGGTGGSPATGGSGGSATGGSGGSVATGGTGGSRPADGPVRRPDAGTNPADASRPDAPPAATGNPFVYVSTGEFGGDHLNIYQLNMQTGELMPRGMAPTGPGPTYGAFHPNGRSMYVLNEGGSTIEAFSINRETGALTKLNQASAGGSGPAHLSVHKSGKWVLSSTYSGGTAAALPIMADGRVGPPVSTQMPGAEAHMIVDDGVTGKFVFVPSKGSNRIAQYRFDEMTGQLTPNMPPFVAQGGQPRHMAFHRSGQFAYLLTEGGRAVVSYAYDSMTGLLSDAQSLTVAAGGSGAHIAVHPTKEFLYTSMRGENTIVVLSLGANGRPTRVGEARNGVSNPWDFAFDPTGTFLLVANDGNSTVRVFRVDQTSGMLTPAGNGANIGSQPHFVGVLP